MSRRCETCGHLWGAYEDDCHCRDGVCHNQDACLLQFPILQRNNKDTENMRTRAYRSSSNFAAGAVIVALVLGFVALNISIGAWALQYTVAYWTLYFGHVAKHIPYLPAAIGGLFLGEITIPAAIATWILSFVL